MTDRRYISTDLYRSSRYDDDKNAPPKPANEFIEWLNALIALAPTEYRGSVKIEFDNDGDYDCPHEELSVYWGRYETDEEVTHRIDAEAASKQARNVRQEAEERAILAALKGKYERR